MAGATTSAGDDNSDIEEPGVVMGHHGLGAPGQVPISEVVDMALFVL
jgi:hypothetical protein